MKKKIISCFIILLVLIIYLTLGEHFNFYLKCPIHFLFNIYCPGCGSTRMLKSILHGNIYQAFRYNPLLFITIPFYLIYLFINYWAEKKHKISLTKKLEPNLWYFLIILFITYGVLRNIPLFKFLAPTIIN